MNRFSPGLLVCLIMVAASPARAQTTITASGYSQDFDSLGAGLPANWTVRTGATGSSLGTDVSGASFAMAATSWATTTGNFRNVASALNSGAGSTDSTGTQGGYTNRALGVRQTASFGDSGAAFTFNLSTTGVALTGLQFSAQILSSQANSTTWTLQYGLGTSPTAFTTIGTFSDPGAFGATSIVASGLGTALNNQSSAWLRVVALTATSAGGTRDTFAIDNFQITATAIPEPSTCAVILGGAALAGLMLRRRKSQPAA